MRKQVLEYEKKNKDLPHIGIIFIGNGAVASFRKKGKNPSSHHDVSYGMLFWLRLGLACMRCYREELSDSAAKGSE